MADTTQETPTAEEVATAVEAVEDEAWNEFDNADPDTTSAPEPEQAADEGEVAKVDDKTPDADLDASKEAAKGTEGEEAKPDPWAEATDEQRTAFKGERERAEKAENRIRSTDGRESALQRQVNELTSQVAAASKTDAKKGTDNDGAAAAEVFESDEWKAFENDYSEAAGPIKAAFNKQGQNHEHALEAMQASINALSTKQSEQDQKATNQDLDDNLERLSEAHDDWATIVKSDEYRDWYDVQPPYMQEAVKRNAENVVDPTEAIDIIKRFKADTQPATPAEIADGANDTEAKRTLQLESAKAPRSKGPAKVSNGLPDANDEDASWKYFEEQDRKAAS